MKINLLLLAALSCAATTAVAGEQTLKFRIIIADTDVQTYDAAQVEGVSIGAHDAMGLALFEDGRFAYKKFVYLDDGTAAKGGGSGYSTFTFDNGDALTAKFTFDWSDSGLAGAYTVLSGTGGYDGATGTGSFHSVPSEIEGAMVQEGSFTIEVPGS